MKPVAILGTGHPQRSSVVEPTPRICCAPDVWTWRTNGSLNYLYGALPHR